MSKLLVFAATGLLAFAPPAPAQDLPAAEQARLEALPAVRVPLRGATLASAIRLLASDAKLSYLSPADADFGDRIGSDATVNPYRMLRLLAKDYHFDMHYEDGIWRFVRINDAELITKAYPLRFNNLTQVSISTGNLNSQLASAAGGSNGMGGGGGGGAPGGAGGSGAPPSSGGLGNVPMELKVSRIVEDVKKILAIPARALAATRAEPDAGSARRAADVGKAFDPIWDPDSSSLFVVATREQHELIAEYLRTVDRPQKLIRIAVKFVETDRSPTQNLGVDWTQSILGGNVPITLSGVPAGGVGGAATGTAGGGGGTAEVALQRTVSLGSHLPVALLSANAMSWTMAAIASDRRSSVVQDPVIFTANNHQVQFKATTEQPIQQGSTTFGSATAATSTQIAYLEVGTQIRVLPSLLPAGGDGREIVQCNFAIDVSSIVGTQIIGGNPYPVTSDRNYSYSVPIPTGKTLVIAGLEERSRLMSDSKVPIFGDIPVLGYAFKNKSDQVTHTTLLAFITPEVIDDPGAGAPVAELPPLRHRIFQGSPTETLSDVSRSLDGLAADIAALQAAARPATKPAIMNALDHIAIELSLMDVRLGELKLNGDRLVAPQSQRVAQDKELLAGAKDAVMQVSTVQGV